MTLRNVTLTAVAALSLGMAAHAQTTTVTVPLNEPGTTAPAATGPGTTVTRQPDGTSSVETTGAVPRPEIDPAAAAAAPVSNESEAQEAAETGTATPANPQADATADTRANPVEPAPAAEQDEAIESTETGTAAEGMDAATPTPTPEAGEPPAAPGEGLPDEASEAQVTAPVPAAEGAAEADAPATDVPASPAETVEDAAAPAAAAEAPAEDAAAEAPAAEAPAAEAPADEAPAAIQNPDVAQTEGTDVDAAAATEPAVEQAPAEEAPAEVPAAEEAAAVQTGVEQTVGEGAEAEEGEAEVAEEHAAAAGEDAHAAPHQEIRDVAFSFEGPFGKYDQFQLQRGLQVYTEVCAGCHGLKQVPLRTLSDPGGPGLPDDQMRAYAAEMSVTDAATGEDRPREPTDMFPTVAGEGMGPDLSLMAKARAGFHGPYGTGLSQLVNGIGGPEYIYSILTGYTGEEMEQAGTVLYGNSAFPGGWISMAPPLSDDAVTFEDGSPTDLDSIAKDMAAFLMWTAEPKMMDRKQAGLISVLFLIVLSVLLYLTNKRLWWPIKHREDTPGDGR